MVVDQANYATHWSKAFTTVDAARAWADKTARKKSGKVPEGQAPKFVGRVEQYEVEP